jgi:hypothetical protein
MEGGNREEVNSRSLKEKKKEQGNEIEREEM